mgnify:CR=1 FL=1
MANNKPTGHWDNPKKKAAQQLFRIGAKVTESDFDRKGRYIKYVFWGISVVLFLLFILIVWLELIALSLQLNVVNDFALWSYYETKNVSFDPANHSPSDKVCGICVLVWVQYSWYSSGYLPVVYAGVTVDGSLVSHGGEVWVMLWWETVSIGLFSGEAQFASFVF